ncbi:MAG: hypothetical protein O3A51_12035 [Verrucomicrobia bacterium]|nr:hypothetical protein [Verrucomicrobiota bacterium]
MLERLDELMHPTREIIRLPNPQSLIMPPGADFDRLAVAYGLSFHRFRLEDVRLPPELQEWQPERHEASDLSRREENTRPGAWTLDAYNV